MFYSQELNVYIHLVCRTLLNSLMQLCSRWHMTSSNNSEKRYEIDNFRCAPACSFPDFTMHEAGVQSEPALGFAESPSISIW